MPEKNPKRVFSSHDIHVIREMRKAAKIHGFREQIMGLRAEALRNYLLKEFQGKPGMEEIRRFSAEELEEFRVNLIGLANQSIRRSGKSII